jgi:crotonobetainyl-CoA:carnitine CoA-transferase CaiB-like acyl-CoA transferase
VIGILAAVIHRQNTGKSQHLDISMIDGMIAFNVTQGAAASPLEFLCL